MGGETAPRRWKGLLPRFVTAVIVASICITPLYFGGYFWTVLVGLFSSRLMYEWIRMTDPEAPLAAFGISIGALLICLAYAAQGLEVGAMASLAVGTCVAVIERLRRGGAFWSAIGLPYIIVPSVVIVLLRGMDVGFNTAGFSQLIFIILVVIAADVGAYFGGKTFRGPKMAPTLSPNKTWSGAISGLVFACFIATLLGWVIGLSPTLSIMLAVPIIILSVLGDLMESSVKRHLGVKDTGTLLPGHGGLLDRLDSLMVAVVGGAILFMMLGNQWPIA